MRRVALKVGGRVFDLWTEVEVVRDLGEISGSFRLSYLDGARAGRALGAAQSGDLPPFGQLEPGQEARVEIDGDLVLLGWIDEVQLEWGGKELSATVIGRDRTGDLVDCAAAPEGPAEYLNVTLLELAQRLARPFGIQVRSEVETGHRFPRFAIEVAETVMSALEKAGRQSAALLVSDGVGGLVITRSGAGRAPADLRVGAVPADTSGAGLVAHARAHFNWRQRFSDYWYKGQQEGDGHSRSGEPALDHTVIPLDNIPAPPPRAVPAEASGILRTGHARDAEVPRHRPRVRLVRTESAGASAQEQADWMMRVARGQSEALTYTVTDWRAGPQAALWRPNELVQVVDRYADIDRDLLIQGVVYSYGPQGARTELRVVGPEAFDRIREDARRRRRHHDRAPAVADNSRAEGLGGTTRPLPARRDR